VNDLITFVANLGALAFLILGIAVAVQWWRNRAASAGWLALAIVLLSLVILLGRLPSITGVTSPLAAQVSLIAFAGSGYALLRYRASLIALGRAWHVAAILILAAAVVADVAATALRAPRSVQLPIALVLLVAWGVAVTEPIVRFLLVARGLPAVQAWRLRALSIGFAGMVAILLLVVALLGAGAHSMPAGVQLAVELVILAIVPLLYASFSPPGWLRREWRASEEEGLRSYLERLLLTDEETANLNEGALEWVNRLTGGAGAAWFRADRTPRGFVGVDKTLLEELGRRLPELGEGGHVIPHADGSSTRLIALKFDSETVVVIAGPFTPVFGREEMARARQFMAAVVVGIDRKRLVAELREANAQLKDASEHKSVFLANMSHELRTPLNAIIGFSELMLDAKESQFDAATQHRFLSQIHSSGKHLLGLINDILDLSKVEAGQMELRLQHLPLGAAVAQVVSIVEPLAGQKSITVTNDVANLDVTADAGKLKQMLLNLVSNAIKFTADGGHVNISARRLRSAVEISVADDGIGIALEDQAKIFREFHQVDPGPGRRQQGTGLGLALTRRFAQLHGGEVRVQSKLGEGSVFTLRLPVHANVGDGRSPDIAGGEPVDMSWPLVLVIEDDASASELLARQLQAGGFRVEFARTGTEAIAKARTLRPAAITLDILLPELDGWEVITRLKHDPETSDVPVVVVSVVDNPELGMALGALDYFVKPVDGRELVERLARFKLEPKKTDGGTTVLVVDDEAANRQYLTRILEPAGFHVVHAAGGREAIEVATARPPDLVLLDLMMPGVTGFDVVEALRANDRTRDTPIMILTARHLTDADKRQLNGHVSTILSRGSVGASDLLGLLHDVVSKRGAGVR
jgi:signal transduction histidine kinase/DNA-binding response OmpR family regulator